MNIVKSMYWRVRSHALHNIRRPVTFLARQLGYELLTKTETVAYLAPHLVATHAGSACVLPEIRDVADPAKVIFKKARVIQAPSYVWRYIDKDQQARQLRCGLLLTDTKLLNTDFWSDDALSDAFKAKQRNPYQARAVLAPFGHYFDGNKLVGYYDFIFLIAVKLCRIKDAMPDEVFQKAVVAYPLVNTSYERELLSLLGFSPDRIFDSRLADIHSEVWYLGNHDNWMHQNLSDILLLKKHLSPLLRSPRTGQNRVYISRADRRRVRNETELVTLLIRYGFLIIEDKPRSLVEQYAIYNNASVIMGPHGASFTNLLWCEPGTHLIELFTGKYAPAHFLYLAQVLDLQYSAYCQDTPVAIDYEAIGADIDVSIPDLERYLDTILV